jgi:hypothetical protein
MSFGKLLPLLSTVLLYTSSIVLNVAWSEIKFRSLRGFFVGLVEFMTFEMRCDRPPLSCTCDKIDPFVIFMISTTK